MKIRYGTLYINICPCEVSEPQKIMKKQSFKHQEKLITSKEKNNYWIDLRLLHSNIPRSTINENSVQCVIQHDGH